MPENTIAEPFNEAADAMHEMAVSKGFYEPVSEDIGLISTKLLLIVSEIVEHYEAIRKGHGFAKEAEELADVIIRLFDYAAWRDLDIDSVIAAKMAINAEREHKHGARF